MQSDLCSDEDLSFMTYSELQFFLFIVTTNCVEQHPQLERKRMSVTAEGDKVLALYRNSHVSYLYPVYVAPP